MVKRSTRKPLEKEIEDWQDRTTGLLRRDLLEEKIKSNFCESILKVAQDEEGNYSVILFDVDYFKSINDLFGHNQGDLVLKEIGKILNEYSSQKDFVGIFGRWGGEEFLIALPYSTLNRAKYIADEIRDIVSNYAFEDVNKTGKTLKQKITISLGVSSVDLTEIISKKNTEEDITLMIKKSDTALDYAKYMGRNNVQTFCNFLVNEIKNLNITRQFYFQNSSKKPKELHKLFKSNYLQNNKKIKSKIKKHFNIIRTEIDPKDTRTKALFTDRLYKTVDNLNFNKINFLRFVRKYI